MSSPSALLKVNYLVMKYLHFGSVRGDLQEGHVYDKRLCGDASRFQFPLFPSTKSGFLCAFALWNPRFRAFRAQNLGFCALLGSGTPVFGHFEHKIGVFVRFCPPEPSFSGFSSTKSAFLCAFGLRNPRFRAFRAQNHHFCARLLNWMSGWGTFPPTEASSHLRSRRTCAAAVPSAVACSRLPPVPPVLPLLAAAPAQPMCQLPLPVAAYRRCCRCSPLHLRSRYYRSLPPLHLPAGAG